MRTLRLTLVAAVAALILAMPAQPLTATKLRASVGPGFTITLTDASGKKVSSLKSGVYEIAVSDKSAMHNFRLKGAGLNWMFTSVPFSGNKTIVLSLLPGSYTYVCDPHATSMKGSFKVA